jgi:hypothetical protein
MVRFVMPGVVVSAFFLFTPDFTVRRGAGWIAVGVGTVEVTAVDGGLTTFGLGIGVVGVVTGDNGVTGAGGDVNEG